MRPLPPFEVVRPGESATPLVHASPHSGRIYPAELLEASALDAAAIRRSEDALVDELIAGAPSSGGVLIKATYARAYIDVNREPYELDQAMFEDELPAFAQSRTARAAAGLGSIARIVAEGQEIYSRKLTFEEARRRVEDVHAPWHAAVSELLDEARSRFGAALLIDWHSMPSGAAGPARRAPDFVLGDRYGAACAGAVTRLVERELEARGYVVTRNAPYAGGWSTARYGRPAEGLHALQIEINRALYLDEKRLEPLPGAEQLKVDLNRLFGALGRYDWSATLR
ncbi:MAG TPA: N-formylglutamate amidohydrolase [Caulobacteraceae bacterium]|jgi:N-formylglutamate amidohydrolase